MSNTTGTIDSYEVTSVNVIAGESKSACQPEFYFVRDVMKRLGICRTSLSHMSNPKSRYFESTFPPKLQLKTGRVGYNKRAVEAWLASRPPVYQPRA